MFIFDIYALCLCQNTRYLKENKTSDKCKFIMNFSEIIDNSLRQFS